MLLVTMEERRWIAEHAVITMGKNIKYPIIDVKKASDYMYKKRKDSGLGDIIIIRQIVENKYKNISIRPTFTKDPQTGVYYGIAVSEDENGNIRWQKPLLTDHISLNLENMNDRAIWTVLRFNPEIKGSPFEKSDPRYEVYDPVSVARRDVDQSKLVRKAMEAIDKLEEKPEEMLYFSRYLGLESADSASFEVIYAGLAKHAMKNPVEFIEKYNNKDRAFYEFTASCITTGVINQNPEGIYVFKNIGLGMNQDEIVNYIKKDSAVRASMVEELKRLDEDKKKIMESKLKKL